MKRVIKICIFGVLLILAGCRSESMVEADELYQENAKKIVFFENYEKGNYHSYDQEELNYTNYSNPAIPFAQSLKIYLGNHPEEQKEIEKEFGRIDMRVSSEIFIHPNTGKRMVFFPIRKGGKVVAVLKSVVNKDFTELMFEINKGNENPLVSSVQKSFGEELLIRGHKIRTQARCIEDVPNCGKSIPEVEIVVIRGNGCGIYESCKVSNVDGGPWFPVNPIFTGGWSSFDPPEYGGGGREDYLTKEEKEELAQLENFYLGQMSEEEKKIYLSMRAYQKRIYLQSAWSSQKSASEKFPNSVYNGKGDAYRHALFSAKTTKLMGKELSERLLTAHEQKVGQHPLEKAMDLYNNDIGRNIPMHMSVWDFDSYIEKLVDEGKLRVISNLAPNGSPTTSSKLIPSNQ